MSEIKTQLLRIPPLMVARGQAETALSDFNYRMWGFEPPRCMYYLSWDQRHTITLELFGSIAGAHLDIVTRYNSPRPYTRAPSGSGVLPEGTEVTPNNARMRDIFLMDTRVSRAWPIRWWGNDSQLILFLDVRNITDRKNVDWIASDGQIGGELRDPGAYRIGRRMRIGIEVRF